MKKAVIIYQSRTGVTKKYAKEIGRFLQTRELDATWHRLEEYHDGLLDRADYLFLGCWTHGLFVLFQRPDKPWSDFAGKIRVPANTKLALFTTYKILSGTMFRQMRKKLQLGETDHIPELKSRIGELSDSDRKELDRLIETSG